jgi:subtilisin-like proprotein convertase family protein
LPPLANVIANTNSTWDVLPSVARTMNWRLTVRDNNTAYGCTHEDDMLLTYAGGAGPFTVTAPNTNVSWPAGSVQTVTWNVANTTAAPVSCANVVISLSTDGGNTFPHVLLASTANDGSETVTIPTSIAATTQARIRVMSVGNIFYDMSNVNFSVTAPSNNYTVTASPATVQICAGASTTSTVSVNYTGSFAGTVNLSAATSNAGITTAFSQTSFTGTGNSTLTISTAGSLTTGTYSVTVTGTSGTSTRTAVIQMNVTDTPGSAVITAPLNGATGVNSSPTFSWYAVAGATTYNLQVSTAANFSSTVVNTTTTNPTFTLASSLNSNTVFYWRVQAVNACSTGTWTSASFTTGSVSCVTVASTDVPKAINSSGTPTVMSVVNLTITGSITDVNVLGLAIAHTYTSDLAVSLGSPAGTSVNLFTGICGGNDNIALNFDSQTANSYSNIPCPAINNGTYQSNQSLNAFNGQNASGTWTLTVADNADLDGGALNAWSINVCAVTAAPLVASASNTPVACFGGTSGTATASATGGSGSYTYLWNNGAITSNITGLTAGTFTVTVTAGSATVTASTTISQPTALVASAVGGIQTATASASGGTGTYSYLWSNGATIATIQTTTAGTFTVTVTDANGCASIATAVVTSATPLSVTASSTNLSCHTSGNGTATALATGGFGNYSYLWSNGGTTANITELAAGVYTVTVTSGSATATASATLTQPNAINVTTSGTNATTTTGTGSATATASGGVSPYTFLWSNGGTTATISNLPIGSYTVTVTGANGCTKTAIRNVLGPNVTVTVSRTNVSCIGGSNGTATATATGGNGSYTFNWSTGATTQAISGLTAGVYTVTVTSGVQTSTCSTTITQPAAPFTATPTVTNTSCGLNNGKVTLAMTNGTGSSYLWSTGATTSSISNQPAGTYIVTVTSTLGCVATASAVIAPSVGVSVNLSVTQPSGASNGSIAANAGGPAPFTYVWSTTVTTSSLTNLGGGTYTVTVTGSNGCKATAKTSLYCPIAGTTATEWIQRVQLGTLDNTSGNNGGWVDFTSLAPPTVQRGVATTIVLTPGHTGNAVAERWRVYIDRNNDGDFADSGESLLSVSVTGTLTNTITVPTNASLGLIRMRIVMRRGTTPSNCGNFANGEVEDYLINVIEPANSIQTNESTVEAVTSSHTHKNLVLSPNPTAEWANLQFVAPHAGIYSLRITDMSGTLVQIQQLDVAEGYSQHRLNLTDLPNGVYVVVVTSSDFYGVERLLLRK